jgi:hypothetical protein
MKTPALILVSILTINAAPAIKTPEIPTDTDPINEIAIETTIDPSQTKTTLTEPFSEPKKIEEKIPTPVNDPKGCEPEQYWTKEPPHNCIDKVTLDSGVQDGAQDATNDRVPIGVHDIGGSGNCATEIAKYDWGQATALAVSMAESDQRPGVVNNNPSTRDYSIGCFQVNIYGANAANRPPQSELIKADVNVRWAYNNYVANGRSFLGQWGVCRKIACY